MFFAAAGGEAAIDIAINEIKSKYDEVTVHRGKKLTYLGIDFDFSKAGEVSLSMCDYVDNTVKVFEEKHGTVTVCGVPANDFLFKSGSDSVVLISKRRRCVLISNQEIKPNSTRLNEEMTSEYHSHIMRIQYLTKHVRYDTVFPVSILNKRIRSPTEKDWNDLKILIGYLKGTRDLKLVLKPGKNLNRVTGYIDASFAVHPDMKGHAGCVVLLGDAPIYVKASAGKINTKSSTEEELCGVHEYSNMVIWIRNLMNEIGYTQDVGIIKQDNMSTMDLIYEGRAKALSTKHIDRRYFYVRDLITRKLVRVVYCRTDMMIADIFTKPLSGYYFTRLSNKLMNYGNVKLQPLPRRQRKVKFSDE
jgi:hypothetical protein